MKSRARFGTIDSALDGARFPPFSAGERDDDDLAVESGEFYHEAFSALLKSLRADGCTTVIRGIGGDEISTVHSDEPGVLTDEEPNPDGDLDLLPPYATDSAREAFRAAQRDLDCAPLPPVSASFYEAAAACAPLYLRNGVWPLYPYGAVELVNFCRQLPVEWRRGRSLQRRYLARRGVSRSVTHPDPPENFLALRDLGLREECSAFVRELFRSSRLGDAGLVDRDRLLTAYDGYLAGNDELGDHLLKIATIELTMRGVERGRARPLYRA